MAANAPFKQTHHKDTPSHAGILIRFTCQRFDLC